ncbi:alpha kinase vwkA [Rhypophila decipiens]|uniref:Alpha kinase vwkA n=1 Tax=Rhypophila decipiens TaxID=261697 RepID=A0AAN6XV44_9PEZI|nr:alpha kinase vwkA [Rhypophila decipiens]
MAAPPRPPYEPITMAGDQETRQRGDATFSGSFAHSHPYYTHGHESTSTVDAMSPEITTSASNRFSFRRIASAISLRSPSPGPDGAYHHAGSNDPAMFAQIRERLRQLELERDELRMAAHRERQRAWEMQRTAEEERAIAERIKRESAAGPSGAEIELRLLQLKYDALLAGADAKPRVTESLFKSVCSTDLLFLIDTTGSMGSYIEAGKTQVRNIMDDITAAFFEEATVRIAVVGYKDHKDKPNVEFLDFTSDVDRVKSFLDELKATGGDDEPEDVLGGINQALNATWKQQTRCIIHIGDAPPHGRTLYDKLRNGGAKSGSKAGGRDDYEEPGTEPHKLTFEPLIKRMVGLNINYALLRINNSTDRMAFEFLKVYANCAASSHCKLFNQNIYNTQARTVTANLSRSSSKRSAARAGLQFEEVQLGTTYNALRHLVVRSVTTSASRTAVRALDRDHKLDFDLDAIKEDEDMEEFSEKPLKTGLDVDKKWDTVTADTLVKSSTAGDSSSTIAKYKSRRDAKRTIVETDKSPPQWETPGWLDETIVAEAFSTNLINVSPTTGASSVKSPLDEMLSQTSSSMTSAISTTEITIHRRSQPFAQGAMRIAAYARTANSTNKLVVKTFKKGGKRLAHMVEDMYCQALCKTFALEFNTLLGSDTVHSLDFIMVTCLKPKTASWSDVNIECLTLEPYIAGPYIKYNSNSGYVNDLSDYNHEGSIFPFAFVLSDIEKANNAAQALSHFTFERSKGQLLISDLQGVGRMLTDPAIHSKDPERFKLADTNLGESGFKFFFATHVCNDVCKKLGLKSTARMIMNGNYEFREDWSTDASQAAAGGGTVCCSNKLCSRIVRIPSGATSATTEDAGLRVGGAGSVTSEKYPGYYWCDICLPQLESSKVKFICVARNGPHHEFEVSRFFYESQGRGLPRVCPGHEKDEDYVPQKAETSGLFGENGEEDDAAKKNTKEGRGVGSVLRKVFCLPGGGEKEKD